MTTKAYGEQLGEFVGVKAPQSLSVQLLQEAEFGVTRIKWDERDCGLAARIAREKAYLVCLQRRGIPTNPYWVDGRPVPMSPVKQGQFTLLSLDSEHASFLSEPIDCMAMYLPQAAFDRFAQEQGVPKIGSMHTPLGVPADDIVVRSLGESLLPALQNPNQSNRLFVEYVALALLAHLASVFGGMRPQSRLQRGALAPWQERRAKELLIENIDGDISLDQLAAACGLSRSHFARAFKASMGVPAHRWLLRERVKRAQDLLLNSSLTLDQIASRCGFADQSHLTRVFSRFARITPGDWRRLYSIK